MIKVQLGYAALFTIYIEYFHFVLEIIREILHAAYSLVIHHM